MIDRRGQRCEVNILFQQPQRIAKFVEFRFALLVGKQAKFDQGNQLRIGPAAFDALRKICKSTKPYWQAYIHQTFII